MTKKIIGIALTLIMLLGVSTQTFAAEQIKADNEINYNDLFMDDAENVIGDLDIQSDRKGEPRVWPGEGPAPQVTSVNIEQVGILKVAGHEGNVGVIVKVMGYGRDYAKYDGITVNYFDEEPFIIYGTGVDGFYYIYDCGTPTLGNHRFDITMRSTNSPYREKSAWATFTIS